MSIRLQSLHQAVRDQADPEKASILQRFFKTGVGDYGEGDLFLGLTVPKSRRIANVYRDLNRSDLTTFFKSPIHEERLIALLILVDQYQRGSLAEQTDIVTYYLSHTKWINNWDLVDTSAAAIVGDYCLHTSSDRLVSLAHSDNLWERRIAIIATFAFIKQGRSDTTSEIATILLHDSHDLIHKAVGWMLREMGKKCSTDVLEHFLETHAATMPRTMLRYAIEKLPNQKRQYYLSKKVMSV
jgi:3-methyladenine DNA glycosylase AlkD